MPRPPPRELNFSDSDGSDADLDDDEDGQLPPGADSQFDLDKGDFPSDSDDAEFDSQAEGDSEDEYTTSGAETSEDEGEGKEERQFAKEPMDEDEEDDSDAEFRTNIAGDAEEDFDGEDRFHLPTVEEKEAEKVNGVGEGGLRKVERRMTEIVRILGDWSKFGGKDGRGRNDYMDQLVTDIATYYGYNEFLAEKLLQLFPVSEVRSLPLFPSQHTALFLWQQLTLLPSFSLSYDRQAISFFDANETPRPVTIRTNTLRTRRRDLAQALINRGVNLEPIGKWTKVGLQVFESAVPIGMLHSSRTFPALSVHRLYVLTLFPPPSPLLFLLGATPEYLAGHYMLQAASSFLPVIALAPQPGERCLDMASAPGGKTTYISALLQNTGLVFANDSNKARTKSLTANVHRLGCKNVVVCNYDGREFPKVMGGFDRVLLDAPCSGTGVISKDATVKVNKVRLFLSLLALILLFCSIASLTSPSILPPLALFLPFPFPQPPVRTRLSPPLPPSKATPPLRHRLCQPRLFDRRLRRLLHLLRHRRRERGRRRLRPSKEAQRQARRHRARVRKGGFQQL
jgi:ribosomal RNA methyltransferase Nop2